LTKGIRLAHSNRRMGRFTRIVELDPPELRRQDDEN
jgi:hypothetical protein